MIKSSKRAKKHNSIQFFYFPMIVVSELSHWIWGHKTSHGSKNYPRKIANIIEGNDFKTIFSPRENNRTYITLRLGSGLGLGL